MPVTYAPLMFPLAEVYERSHVSAGNLGLDSSRPQVDCACSETIHLNSGKEHTKYGTRKGREIKRLRVSRRLTMLDSGGARGRVNANGAEITKSYNKIDLVARERQNTGRKSFTPEFNCIRTTKYGYENKKEGRERYPGLNIANKSEQGKPSYLDLELVNAQNPRRRNRIASQEIAFKWIGHVERSIEPGDVEPAARGAMRSSFRSCSVGIEACLGGAEYRRRARSTEVACEMESSRVSGAHSDGVDIGERALDGGERFELVRIEMIAGSGHNRQEVGR
ncbi:hypothetical protein DFH09DRAFT_1079278 [Mycena vulgaris]|nr:hypothetical protein DFH09DRAFT_1079278 [Mycena vulgaris]